MGRMPSVLAALDTPLSDDGERFAPERVAPLLCFLSDRGVDGFFVAGSTGLGPLLSTEEWRLLVDEALAAGSGSLMLCNASAPSTRDTCERAEYAAQKGAHGVVVATPAAYRYEKRAVLEYFKDALKAASPAPVYLYRKLGDPWGAAELESLAEAFDNLKGVKDSATQMAEHLQLIRVADLDVYQGYEALIASSVQAGGAGPVSGLATVLPEIVADVTKAAAAGDANVWADQDRLTRVRAVVCGTNPYAAFKALLKERGVPVGIPRRPFLPMTPEEVSSMVETLNSLGVQL